MQTLTSTYHPRLAEPTTSLGRRRDHLDLVRFSLDLTWARPETERAVRAKDYPSPPMSGSPPLPPKQTHEAGGWNQGRQQSTSHDVYRGPAFTATSTATAHGPDIGRQQQHHQHHQEHHSSSSAESYSYPHAHTHAQHHQYRQQHHEQPPPPRPYSRPYQLYSRSEDPSDPRSMPSSTAYHQPQHSGPAMSAYPSYFPQLPGPGPMQQGYPIPASNRPPQPPPQAPSPIPASASASVLPGREDAIQPFDSPKSQRKTKGHVASACVPCKKAHLRCDSQRPCSRCLSNNKEDACVDVQHKKRGRPRLREDRDLRYDLSGRGGPGGHSVEAASHAPAPMPYGQSVASLSSGYDDSRRRGYSSSHKVIKSQPADSMAPRFIERGSMAGANIYPAPSPRPTRPIVPAAYLTMSLGISKASSTFLEAIGRQNMNGLNIMDAVVAADHSKLQALQHQMQDERVRKDPQYLPPIFAARNEERIIQALGFGPGDVARFSLDRPENLTFRTQDGQQRGFHANFGLAKQESIYFVVLLLHMDSRPLGHPTTPSPQSREVPYSYQALQYPPKQQQFAQPTPLSANFDANVNRSRLPGDAGLAPVLHPPPPSGSVISGLNPSLPSAYSASPSRSDYPVGPSSYETPRSELGLATRPHIQPPSSSYQLPPIRGRHENRPLEFHHTARDDNTRVDIEGLIDKPEPSNKHLSR